MSKTNTRIQTWPYLAIPITYRHRHTPDRVAAKTLFGALPHRHHSSVYSLYSATILSPSREKKLCSGYHIQKTFGMWHKLWAGKASPKDEVRILPMYLFPSVDANGTYSEGNVFAVLHYVWWSVGYILHYRSLIFIQSIRIFFTFDVLRHPPLVPFIRVFSMMLCRELFSCSLSLSRFVLSTISRIQD
jgi:hypothetical protein